MMWYQSSSVTYDAIYYKVLPLHVVFAAKEPIPAEPSE